MLGLSGGVRLGAAVGVALMVGSTSLHWVAQEQTHWNVGSDYWKMLGAPWLVSCALSVLVLTLWRPGWGWRGAVGCVSLGIYNALKLHERLEFYRRTTGGQVVFELGPGPFAYGLGAMVLLAATLIARSRDEDRREAEAG